MENAIVTLEAKEFGIEEKKAKEITAGISTILEERKILSEKYKEIIKLDISEETIPQFRELRLQIRNNRTKGIETWHTTNKAFYLAGGRFVDAIKNKEIAENLRMEEALNKAENYFAELEQQRMMKINQERIAALSPYLEDTTGLSLAGMEQDVWEAYLTAKKNKWEAEQAELRKAEQERLEAEKREKLRWERAEAIRHLYQFFDKSVKLADLSEKEFKSLLSDLEKKKKAYDKKQAEIAAENAKLKKEAEKSAEIRSKRSIELRQYLAYVPDIEKVFAMSEKYFQKALQNLKKEYEEAEAYKAEQEKNKKADEQKRLDEQKKQAKIQAKKDSELNEKLKVEREKREALEKSEKQRKEQQQKELAEAEAERKRLAKAPVKEKLNLWVDSFDIPNTDVENLKVENIKAKFLLFKEWAKREVDNI